MSVSGVLARRLAVAAGSLVLALGLAELAARTAGGPEAPIRLGQFESVVVKRHKVDFGRVFASDPELFWRLRPGVVLPEDARPLFGRVSNDQGFRKERATERAAAPGAVRILFLGDSCTFGYLLACADSVAEQTERELARRAPDTAFECLNAGVPGYSLWQSLRSFELHGRTFAPDLVVVQAGWNEEVSWDGWSDPEQAERLRAARPPAAVGWSALGARLWRARRPAGEPAPSEKRPRLSPEQFREVLGELARATEAAGAELLVLLAPCEPNLEGPKVRTAYQVEQIRFAEGRTLGSGGLPMLVDGPALVTRLAREHAPAELFLDSVHTSALANAAMAQALAERILAWRAARPAR